MVSRRRKKGFCGNWDGTRRSGIFRNGYEFGGRGSTSWREREFVGEFVSDVGRSLWS